MLDLVIIQQHKAHKINIQLFFPDNPSHINISHRFGLIMLPYVGMPEDFILVQFSVTCTFQTNMQICEISITVINMLLNWTLWFCDLDIFCWYYQHLHFSDTPKFDFDGLYRSIDLLETECVDGELRWVEPPEVVKQQVQVKKEIEVIMSTFIKILLVKWLFQRSNLSPTIKFP